MRAPELSVEQVKEICPNFSKIKFVGKGGQKTVFSGFIDGINYAIKFLDLTNIHIQQVPDEFRDPEITVSPTEDIREDVLARAKREIDIMDRCETPTLVKLGPIGMNLVEYDQKKSYILQKNI